MAMTSEEFVISVNKNNNSYYRVHTIWRTDELCVNVASENGAWSGTVSKKVLENFGRLTNTAPDQYLETAKAALTTPKGLPELTYSVENNSFTWKKLIDEDTGVKIKLGSIPLEPASFPTITQNMIGVALAANEKLEGKIQNLEKEKIANEAGYHDLLDKLELAAKLKNDMETDLMSQFLAILNAKKTKIADLEVELIKAKAEGAGSSRPVQKPRSRKTKVRAKPDVYEVDTDDDLDDMPLARSSRSLSSIKDNQTKPPETSSSSTEMTTLDNSPKAGVSADCTSMNEDIPETSPFHIVEPVSSSAPHISSSDSDTMDGIIEESSTGGEILNPHMLHGDMETSEKEISHMEEVPKMADASFSPAQVQNSPPDRLPSSPTPTSSDVLNFFFGP